MARKKPVFTEEELKHNHQIALGEFQMPSARLAAATSALPRHKERMAVLHETLDVAAHEWTMLGTSVALAKLEAEFAKCSSEPAATEQAIAIAA